MLFCQKKYRNTFFFAECAHWYVYRYSFNGNNMSTLLDHFPVSDMTSGIVNDTLMYMVFVRAYKVLFRWAPLVVPAFVIWYVCNAVFCSTMGIIRFPPHPVDIVRRPTTRKRHKLTVLLNVAKSLLDSINISCNIMYWINWHKHLLT